MINNDSNFLKLYNAVIYLNLKNSFSFSAEQNIAVILRFIYVTS